MTDELRVETSLHAPPTAVYALLRHVEGYGRYVEHVDGVTRHGDGGAGTSYEITLSWWRLSYTAWVLVTDLDPPGRIAWRVTDGLDAEGAWTLEPATVDDPDVDQATNVALTARYDPDSGGDAVSLPPLVPWSAVLDRLRPVVEREARHVLERVVADLEGEPRAASLSIEVRHDVE